MSLINESYDSLPYVDAPPSQAQLASALDLIQADIQAAGIDTSQLHPALISSASSYTPVFSGAIEEEHARLQENPASKLNAIDTSRYEALDPPENTDPTSDEAKPELLRQWNETLRKAYTSSEYLNSRLTELGLLEKFGKNAWLVGNSQLEDVLRGIETELAGVRERQEAVEQARRTAQESVKGEMDTLEQTWKRGVGRVLETEVAAEGLKQRILEKRRAGAV